MAMINCTVRDGAAGCAADCEPFGAAGPGALAGSGEFALDGSIGGAAMVTVDPRVHPAAQTKHCHGPEPGYVLNTVYSSLSTIAFERRIRARAFH
jgi:hypothetical protein